MATNKSHNDNIRLMMLAMVLIGWLAGFLIGGLVAEGSDDSSSSSATEQSSTEHNHEMFEVDSASAPVLDISLKPDAKSGYNLHLAVDKFTFSPENAGGSHNDNEGHAHLYINGEKITRLYGPDHYIGELPEGENIVMVTLNTNDHKDYAVNGEPVADSLKVIVDDHDDHSHIEEADSHSHEDDGHMHE